MATKKKTETDKVALYADHGLYDNTHGRLNRGYNIVTNDEVDFWLSLNMGVRKASAEEVASAYGVK